MNSAAQPHGMSAMIQRIFGKTDPSPAIEARSSPQKRPPLAPRQLCKAELLNQISTLLIDSELEVTPGNLAVAFDAYSGNDLQLARKLAARQLAGETIDQTWLDTNAEPGASRGSRAQDMEHLAGRVEGAISQFTGTTRMARLAAKEYSDDLTQHVSQLAQPAATDDVITTLADMAKAMLERTLQIEAEMKRSEREADSLRKRLDAARQDASIDHLTGLPNRRAFEELFEREYREAQQAIEPLSVGFCDIDHFKQINDTHGHETGDRVLQAIAETLKRISNKRCHVARHGGEEFVMLFRGCNKQDALETLDRARLAIAERHFVNRVTDLPIGQITFSGGIADVFAYANPRDALRAADMALYQAKEEGRNRIQVA